MASTKAKNNYKISDFVAHGSTVNCLALSPSNGHMLATGGDDRRVNLWLVGKPNNIMSISGITSPVLSVAFNNSENWIGAGSKSGIIKVFDLAGNRDIRTISGHKAAITSLDFHLYGDILASGSMDTNLKVWDARRKGCLFTYKGHTEAVKDIKFSPDGQWVVSASSDATVKVWNLIAGKMIADFKLHSGPVTSVQFHPRELLMASGSADKTVKFYDLERLEVVSETTPESNGVRKVLFHEAATGNSAGPAGLLAGTQESLKVYGWEPSRVFDMLPVHWGKVEDMIISGEQLIAASMAQTNVSVWYVDIKNLRPFSGDSSTIAGEAPPPSLLASARGQFEYEKKEISPPSSAQSSRDQKRKESLEGEAVEEKLAEGNEENSPPTDVKEKDRREIFAARQRMIRTPPKKFKPFAADPSSRVSQAPQPSSPSSRIQHVQEPPQASEKRKLHNADDPLQVKHKYQEEPRAVKSEPNLSPKPPEPSDVTPSYRTPHHKPSHPSAQPISHPPQRKAPAAENPSRAMIEDFAPPKPRQPHADIPSSSQVSESRILADISTNHCDVVQILESRLNTLKQVRASWSVSNPRVSVEIAIDSNNESVLVDLLNILQHKRSLWNLDLSLLVLPELKALLCSKYKQYASCGCSIIKLILKSFGPVIKTNIAVPPAAGGRDLQREERYEKCQQCHAHLTSLREIAGKIVREGPGSSVGKLIREQALLTAFNCLD